MKTDAQARYRSAERFVASREFFGMKLGLENISEYTKALGNPQLSYPSVHIAGTNGKGSTVVTLGSILRQAGYKTGVFTSPHLVDFRERIRVNGRKIEKRFVSAFIERQRKEIREKQITYFEVMVALAASYFASRKVDIAIFETGLGGRLDATNILAPLVCGISEISLDHTSILGDTLAKIAGEKGGIIKQGAPVALGVMPDVARRTLQRIALGRSAPVLNLVSKRVADQLASSHSLPGACQTDNLRLALTILRRLRKEGYTIPDSAVCRGLRDIRWPGRFQSLRGPNGSTIILDVAHNESGIRAAVETFRERYPEALATIVVGLVKNKRQESVLAGLKIIAKEFIATRLPTRRTLEPEELSSSLKGFAGQVSIVRSPRRAFARALRRLGPGEITLIIGSHYLVGEFLKNRSSLSL